VVMIAATLLGCASTKDKEPKDPVAERILALENAVDAAPNDARAHYALGNAYFDAQRYVEAGGAYRQATTLDSTFADAYTNLGLVYRVEGDIESAIAQYEQALALVPTDAVTRRNLIVALESADRLPQAASHLAELSRQNPDDLALLQQVAVRYHQLEQFPEAEAAYGRLLAKVPGDAASWYALGVCQQAQAKTNDAITSWSRAIAVDVHLVAAHEALVTAYTNRGDYEHAWNEVRETQRLGGFVDPVIMERLQDASGKLGPD
jgi:tetratricopeptide (TPR) repeat protein